MEELEAIGLSAPEPVYLMKALRRRGFDVREDVFTVDGAVEELKRLSGGMENA